jgi:hypothetical protein
MALSSSSSSILASMLKSTGAFIEGEVCCCANFPSFIVWLAQFHADQFRFVLLRMFFGGLVVSLALMIMIMVVDSNSNMFYMSSNVFFATFHRLQSINSGEQ